MGTIDTPTIPPISSVFSDFILFLICLSADYVNSQIMSTKRASSVTVCSLLKLCKQCSSQHIAECIKGLNTLRAMSTAVERTNFQFSGGHQNDDSLGYQQSHVGFYQESRKKADTNELFNKQRPDYVTQANASQSYWNNHASLEQNSYGARQMADGGHINVPINVNNNLMGHNGSANGYFVQDNMKMQQKVGVGVDNTRASGMHPNTFVDNHGWAQDPEQRMKSPNAYSSPGPLESQGNLRGGLNQNIDCFQWPSTVQYKGGNEMHQQYSGSRQIQQSLKDGQYSPNFNIAQRSVIGSHLSTNANPDGESTEASNDSPYRGTLEELDSFCAEGKVKEAVEVLELLEKQLIPVDLPRCLQLMHQCGETKSLEEAKIVHRHALQHLSPLQVSTYNRILEMYLECGSVDDAVNIFNNMPERNLTTWDTMITQLAKNGFAEDSIDLFTQFKNLGLKPDGQMFIGVLSACSVLGDIDEGMLHFESMSRDYGIIPSMAHFVSVVDMIGSIGHLDEAFEFIEKMKMEPSADIWETLMNLCRVHGNTGLGDRCAELLEQLDPSRLSDQSKAGLVPVKASNLTKEKEKRLASKNLLEVRSRVHEYRAGDTSHPENDKIYALLRGLKSQMKEAGYIPETKFVLHDIDQEGKEEALLAHSERLAVAYGLLSSSARSPIRVIKNLRVCGDCHTALKIISKLVGRELIIRDAKRFHHFKDGLCSCRDYW